MRLSVIVRSKDEADRLRLTLASLGAQSTPVHEVVVVNDGSADHTAAVLTEAAASLPLVAVHHPHPVGRSGASNAGAARASGDLLLFLDGDTPAAPDLAERHLAEHRREPGRVLRGETLHLRCTRPFRDPEAGTPQPGEETRVARMTANERERSRVTRAQIRDDFAAVDRRAQPGIYPGFGPRRLYELELDALRTQLDGGLGWIAASGSNMSVARATFLEVGGFDADISINEHRELALRLQRVGAHVALTAGRTYHLTHRSGWRDPLADTAWLERFYALHPLAEVALLPMLWASLSDEVPFPEHARIASLPALAAAAARCRDVSGVAAVQAAHVQRSRSAVPA